MKMIIRATDKEGRPVPETGQFIEGPDCLALVEQMGWLGISPQMRTVVCGPMYHSAPNTYAILAGRSVMSDRIG